MISLKVFYHVYIPADLRACSWTWHVDQQLQLIKHSKLHDIAQVNMLVTMPAYWYSLFGSDFMSIHTHAPITFADKLREYVGARYPWVNVAEVRDISENLFEGATLKYFHQMSMQEDFLGLYIHTKGIIPQSSPSVGAWREILNHYCITQWAHNVKLLNTHQVVALNDILSVNAPVVSGNFFWARSDYVRTLCDPIQSTSYTENADCWPGSANYRYAFELWVLHNNPQVHYVCDTSVNHYDEYCFLEDLIKKE